MSGLALLGVQSCGCITLIDCEPDRMSAPTQKAVARIIRDGGQIIRASVEEARAMPHFFPMECPHDPKGWEYEPPKLFEPSARCRSVGSRDVWRVDIKTHGWEFGGFSAGEVRKWNGAWWACEGWFNHREAGAHYGDDSIPEYGPFNTKKEAVAHLLPLGVKAAEKFRAEIIAAREARAAS